MAKRKASAEALRRRRAQLAARLTELERILRGSLVSRYRKCGKRGCHCARGKGHGPADYLSVTLAQGRTRSYYLAAGERRTIARYIRNYWRLRETIEEITRINRELLERGELERDW